jgi:hypothetical protein
MVTFFIDPFGDCPAGWKVAANARGRLILGTTDPARAGKLWGTPFSPGQLLPHAHQTDVYLRTPRHTAGRLTYAPGPAGLLFDKDWYPRPKRLTSPESSLGLPFMQMLPCEKESDDNAALDTMPPDAVSYFTGNQCPARAPGFEWVPYDKADGRFIVPLVPGGESERAVAVPWKAGPPPQHRHESDQHLAVKDIEGNGAWCLLCGLTEWQGPRLDVRIVALPQPGPEPFPYVELMVCRKSGSRRKNAPKPPPLITFFRAGTECADYFRAPASPGRFLVGLPENGEPNRVYGEPLKDGEDRLHTHRLTLKANAQTVDVGNGRYPREIGEQLETEIQLAPNGPHLPYIQLTQCWWKCPVCGDSPQKETNHD